MTKTLIVSCPDCGSAVEVRDRYKCTMICGECTSMFEVSQNIAEFYSAVKELGEKGLKITVENGEVFAADKYDNKHAIENVMFFNGKSAEEIVECVGNHFIACCE